jgi:hypothetical protein
MDIPWDYIFGTASGATVVVVLAVLLGRKIVESAIDNTFETRLAKYRASHARDLEFDKSDLLVWEQLRKDILSQVWAVHHDIVKRMSEVIWSVQKIQHGLGCLADSSAKSLSHGQSVKELTVALDAFRRDVHDNVDLVDPEAIIQFCQSFTETAYSALSALTDKDVCARLSQIETELKVTRGKFAHHTGEAFGINRMMPWVAHKKRSGA